MNSELARRIAFTLGALLVYRFGTYIPLHGIDQASGQFSSFLRSPVSIFSLSIIPYLSAAIIIQLVSMVSSRLNAIALSGEAGRRRIARYTLGLAMLLTAFQAFGIVSTLQAIPNVVAAPGAFFLISATATLMGGVVFLVWLSEQITARGIGNGFALILFAGIAVSLPRDVASLLELSRQGALSGNQIALYGLLSVATIGLIVFIELARRRVPVEFAARRVGDRSLPSQSSYLSLKINSAGMMPSVVAPWLYTVPLALAAFVLGANTPWVAAAFGHIQQGQLAHMILSTAAIFILAFVYTSFVLDPGHAADSLQKHAGMIPGIEPGEPTAGHLDRIVSYTTLIGATYLAAVFLIPELLLGYSQIPIYFGGGSALVVVCTILDIQAQVRGGSLTKPGGEYV